MQRRSGFTILELMIVVAVLAIVMSVAIPSMQTARKSANSTQAIGLLKTMVSTSEQYRVRFGSYPGGMNDMVNVGLIPNYAASPGAAYNFGFSSTSASWSMTATPRIFGTTAGPLLLRRSIWCHSVQHGRPRRRDEHPGRLIRGACLAFPRGPGFPLPGSSDRLRVWTPKRYRIGDVIEGRFRVLAKHVGYLGLVYIVRVLDRDRTSPPRYAAIKTFRLGERLHRALFDRELANWIRLPRHPNVVHAVEADREHHLLVLEFVRGPSLKTVAHRCPVAPEHFVAWARDIASGLRFLHEENSFLHRDLRPANVLVETDGLIAKISDLGLGKPFDPNESAHTAIGTFNYMAPEQFQNRTDFRSDLFSFGATLYYLLTGHDAVRGSTERIKAVRSPTALRPTAPDRLESLVLRCLEPDPDRRFSRASEICSELETLEAWQEPETEWSRCERHSYRYTNPKGDCPVL